jgi:GNAT superfamily N-acetyltransferase
VRVRRLAGPRELEEVAGDVPWVRWGVGFDAGTAWRDDGTGALAIQRSRPPYGSTLAVLGEPAAALELAQRVVATGDSALGAVRSVTLPRSAEPPPGPLFGDRPAGESWDWMWTPSAPAPQPGEERVGHLDVTAVGVVDEVTAFLARHSPRHSAVPGDPRVRRWLAVCSDSGELVATVALYEVVPGVDLMASVAVAGSARGQGLGAAVVAAATRRALAERPPVATVDLYADNRTAHSLYGRLGYRLDQQFTSYPLAR